MRRAGLSLILLAALGLTAAPAAAVPETLSPAYDVDLAGSEGGLVWEGTEAISFANPEAAPVAEVVLRLWGNGIKRRCGSVEVSGLQGAQAAAPELDCTLVRLTLDAPLAPGARAQIAMHLRIEAPVAEDRFGRAAGLAQFSNALPVLAAREDGAWRADPYSEIGESFVHEPATWRVRLAGAPVAATGTPGPDGVHTVERARDFAWVSGDLVSLRRGRIRVVAARGTRSSRLRLAMTRATRALHRLEALYGPYAWPELDVVLSTVSMEHTGLVMASEEPYLLAHEMSHQWWFALVGSDQFRSPWLDEGFATWSEDVVNGIEDPSVCRHLGGAAMLMTRDVAYWRGNARRYVKSAYRSGACLLHALSARIGRARFRAGLRRYVLDHRYEWSTAEDFRRAMEGLTAPGRLTALWRRFGL